MKQAYDINLFDGHLIITENGKDILVDTGSPFTLSRDCNFLFMGKNWHMETNIAGKTIDTFCELVGRRFDVLLGMDIMCGLSVLVDYKQKQAIFSDEEFSHEGFSELTMEQVGAITIPITVKGRLMNFALDTGAKISYIDNNYISAEVSIDELDDFSPFVGHFTTNIYDMQATIGDTTFPVKFGTLPRNLSSMLRTMGLDGAIGYDLFAAFTVIMDFKRDLLFYK